ncbi:MULTISPECIES: type II toxin-antitoxin system VapC family toxin [Sphingobium]|uniref:Ribonuclease VapC n=2 Tax=Sphingobium TaxID=165695 RepID=A0A292ZP35_SPHSA|nr:MULTISPECIES: type II toxin-antitoxin system VapC family toxin [Sphingobium]MCB4861871.1 type II toxin-antitoxin system VapC family toxin [Sphingobium sp. PNB]NML91125.1 type II toxin-antitoxin system VapC family toxin [Sphingobium sp. TB-6]OAP29829.1 transcriptional regulator [Sphingobium sp. 20006FA]KXU30194.1 transcriptional regulator [Sphingobium sp. AM]KYC30279.1 transcriptional regulator [Sphingobium sp. 22B]
MSSLYMLDTNIISELARNPHGGVAKRIAEVGPDAICVSIVTAAELRYGCAKKGSPRLLAQIDAILDSVQILALDVPADTEYGGIRAELEAAGKPIGPNDLFIAAHAYALDATLVTANMGEFSRVRALKVENWITDPH